MATPTIREALGTATSGVAATVTTGAGTQVDDVLVCFAGNDSGTAGALGPPTGTAGTWTLQATGDNGTSSAHLKIYTRAVTVGGAQTVTVSPIGSEEVCNSVIVLVGADTASPADGAAGGNGASSASHIAPAVSPATSDALLLCGAQTDGTASSACAYAPPSGMTEQTDIRDGTFCGESVASLVLSSSGSTGTKTFTNSPNTPPYATGSIAVKGATAAASIPPPPVRLPQSRDPSEAPWIQKDRRNANLVATAANPLPSPLDSAWQADARYWHLYNDIALRPSLAYFQQKDRRNANLVATPANPLVAPLDSAWQADARYWHLYNDVREQVWQPQQRPYVSDPSLFAPAAPDIPPPPSRSVSPRDYGEVQWGQRVYFDTTLLLTAQLEDPLLSSGETDKRYNLPATHVDRRLYPQQPQRESDQSSQPSAPDFDPLLAGWLPRWLAVNVSVYVDRRESPTQRLYGITAPDDVTIVGAGTTCAWWGVDDTVAFLANARRNYDLNLAAPTVHDPVLSAWLPLWLGYNRAATHVDRREVPQQRLYISDPSFYPTVPPTDPLTLAWGDGGNYWTLYNTAALQISRRLSPQQRSYVSDPSLLLTALLENELLGGADVSRHYAVFSDRRQTIGYQPRYPDPSLNVTVTDPLTLANGVGGDTWRRYNTPAYVDRREVPQQPPRRTLYFDAGPDVPPLTLSWGAGGRYWHLYQWRREARSWWQPRPVFTFLGDPCHTIRPGAGFTVYTLPATTRPNSGTTVDPC